MLSIMKTGHIENELNAKPMNQNHSIRYESILAESHTSQ